jgi:hypothetical protein
MLHNVERFNQWRPALFDGQFDWDFLLPAFKGTKIQPMDFDAVIERNGKFLIFETKASGKPIELGQSITLTHAWKNGATIVHLEGKSPKEICGFALYLAPEYEEENGRAKESIGARAMRSADAFDVLYVTRCWFCFANGERQPNRKDWDNELWQWDYDRTAA